MPEVIVRAHGRDRVVYRERVAPHDFETDHFRRQIAERIAWAVDDAQEAERFERLDPAREQLALPAGFA